MAFVNEFASEADIQKYKLRELWRKFFPSEPFPQNLGWTVDHQRGNFLRKLRYNRDEHVTIWLLAWNDRLTQVRLRSWSDVPEGNDIHAPPPYHRFWEFHGLEVSWLNQPSTWPKPEELPEFFRILKAALSAYGNMGVIVTVPVVAVFDESFDSFSYNRRFEK